MKRIEQRYLYAVATSHADRKVKRPSEFLTVGADWYISGRMMRYVYKARYTSFIARPGLDHEGHACIGTISERELNEYGWRVKPEDYPDVKDEWVRLSHGQES